MKANYKNWVPDGMVYGVTAGAVVSIILFVVISFTEIFDAGVIKTVLSIIFGIASIRLLVFTALCWLLILPFIFWGFLTALVKGTEEKWLRKQYGTEYDLYCKRVNRFIPWTRRD